LPVSIAKEPYASLPDRAPATTISLIANLLRQAYSKFRLSIQPPLPMCPPCHRRAALEAGVDASAGLANRVKTGGRLNLARSITKLLGKPDPAPYRSERRGWWGARRQGPAMGRAASTGRCPALAAPSPRPSAQCCSWLSSPLPAPCCRPLLRRCPRHLVRPGHHNRGPLGHRVHRLARPV
jgi:hypothetical protein